MADFFLSGVQDKAFSTTPSGFSPVITPGGTTNQLAKFTGPATIGNSAVSDDGTSVTILNRAVTATVDDANNVAVINILSLLHSTTGVAGNGIGSSMTFLAEDSAGQFENMVMLAGKLTNATSGAEESQFDIYTRTAGAAPAIVASFNKGAMYLAPSTMFAGVGRITVPSTGGMSTDATGVVRVLVSTDAGGNSIFGSSATTCTINGTTTTVTGSTNLFLDGADVYFLNAAGNTTSMRVNSAGTYALWGSGDGTATTGSWIFKGPQRTGADAGASSWTYQAPNGTGAGQSGMFKWQTGIVTGASSVAQVMANRMSIGGGTAIGSGGVCMGAYAVNTVTDPGDGRLCVAASVNAGIVYVGDPNQGGRLQQSATTTIVAATVSNAATLLDFECAATTGGTGQRIRAWNYAGTATAGRLFSVGDGAAFTEAWAINFDGKMVNQRAANETATATAGGVQAVPATVRGYLSFVDSGGTTRKIPYFDV